jgi:hypothetical protein
MSTPIETNTEELQEILKTVNNLPNLGGTNSADLLVVRIDFDHNENGELAGTGTASHSVSEINEAINAGKVVITTDSYGMLVPIYYCEDETAHFSMTSSEDEFLYITEISIGEDKNAIVNTETIELNGGSGGGGFSIPVIDLAELGFENIIAGQSQMVQIDDATYEQYGTLMRTGIVQIKFSCELESEPYDYVNTAIVSMEFDPSAPAEIYDTFVFYEACCVTTYFTLHFQLTPDGEAYVRFTNVLSATSEG